MIDAERPGYVMMLHEERAGMRPGATTASKRECMDGEQWNESESMDSKSRLNERCADEGMSRPNRETGESTNDARRSRRHYSLSDPKRPSCSGRSLRLARLLRSVDSLAVKETSPGCCCAY